MKIRLQELPHQQKALEAINEAFYGLDSHSDDLDRNFVYANPLIKFRGKEQANIDIKMETGTGKTFVGVNTIYEMHKKYGLFKFVIVVPSPAIKEGWRNFIEADFSRQHFQKDYENTHINLTMINAGDFDSSKGLLPAHLVEFIEGDRNNTSTIEVLLINSQMLNSANMEGIYTSGKNKGQDRFNQTMLNGYTKPIEALRAIRPVVIIDEPHKFPRGKSYYDSIKGLNPQMIIRFGATFPEVKKGSGRSAVIVKDYYRGEPQFNLNAVQAFNDGLVKGIDVYFPNITEAEAKDQCTVERVVNKELVLKRNGKTYTYKPGDDIGMEGDITYAGGRELSNGLELDTGMTLLPATMKNSYQELIIKQAIDKHFEVEQKNFMRESVTSPKVKTLTLFFIDSIKSYRHKEGWLKQIFEKHLKKKLDTLVAEYEFKTGQREVEYLSFLRATQKELQQQISWNMSEQKQQEKVGKGVHAGYFGEDRESSDEGIQAEVSDILENKEKLLSFKDDKGNWETRRFLFSKWTLREGWDNPNVFVIAKLRTSGSEISKIQEVGRGLRLPLDETGERLNQEDFSSRLSYLISYDERDFAEKLVSEVNSDAAVQLDTERLTRDMISVILDYHSELDEETLLEELDNKGIIKRNNDFKKNGLEELLKLYPVLAEKNRVKKDRITTGDKKVKERIKLKKENWQKMRDLWERFSHRYMLEFDRLSDNTLQLLLDEVMNNEENFVRYYPDFNYKKVGTNTSGAWVEEKTMPYAGSGPYPGIVYGKFIKRLAEATKLQPRQIHRSLAPVLREQYDGDTTYLSEETLKNLVRNFKAQFENRYAQSYQYQILDFQASTSVYDTSSQDFKEDILATVIGVNEDEDYVEDNKHLYELPPLRYDSVHPEKELLSRHHDSDTSIISFGKIPRRAIQIPKYIGGTTTPDFVYIVEKKDKKRIYLLVETKAEGDGKRIGDEKIIDIHKSFFSQLKEYGIEYQEAERPNQVWNKLRELVEMDED